MQRWRASALVACLLVGLGALQDNPWPFAGAALLGVLLVRDLGADRAVDAENP